MTQFNPQKKDTLTYGECLSPIFDITDKEDAMRYKKDYIAFIQKDIDNGIVKGNYSAEQIANSNIGYWAGYGSSRDRARIEELFECSHPVFGSVRENGIPTAKEAFECGKTNKTLNQLNEGK